LKALEAPLSAQDFGYLLGGLIGSTIGLVIVVAFVLGVFCWPLMAFSAMRSLRRIAVALERLSERPSSTVSPEPEIGPWRRGPTAVRSESSSAEPSR
jgi:hypothetical protein